MDKTPAELRQEARRLLELADEIEDIGQQQKGVAVEPEPPSVSPSSGRSLEDQETQLAAEVNELQVERDQLLEEAQAKDDQLNGLCDLSTQKEELKQEIEGLRASLYPNSGPRQPDDDGEGDEPSEPWH